MDDLKKKLAENPGNLEIMNEVAIDYIEKGEIEEGIKILEEIISKDENNIEANYNLGVAHLKILENDLEHDEYFEDQADSNSHLLASMKYFQKVLDNDPKNYSALNNLAVLNSLNGNLEEGVRLLEKSLEIEPNQPEIQEELEDWKEELEIYKNEDYDNYNDYDDDDDDEYEDFDEEYDENYDEFDDYDDYDDYDDDYDDDERY